jgi:hypothetical protein
MYNAARKLSAEEIKAIEDSLVNDPLVPADEADRTNPLARNGMGYFYYDETWSQVTGPFETLEQARKALSDYAHWLDTGEMPADRQE